MLKKLKMSVSVLLSVMMMFSSLAFADISATAEEVTNTSVPAFAKPDNLYAHAKENHTSTNAWQRWETFGGPSAKKDVYYFFLPQSASDTEVEIYNTYKNAVEINGTKIMPETSAVVSYKNGEEIKVKTENTMGTKTLCIYKSDSEASLYFGDTTGSYTDHNGNVVNKDFYSFLVSDKENYVSGSDCTIIDNSGITETVLKKIKGRGNSTWKDSDKKPFNINFNDKTKIAGLENKKFSLLANAKEGSLLRNRIMYDLADEVGSLYSSDSRFVDLYFNGDYKGSYQITKKVEMGKSSLVALKDESETLTENFNFLVEVDIWNYAGDTNFVSNKDLHIVLKTPELENYDSSVPQQKAVMDFIQNKYKTFENALYNGDMASLEKICDTDSLARAYLLQEFGKNCDGGMTSCYFTYVAEKGKFIADPIWDCDSCLGNVTCTRQNATNTCKHEGWAIKTAQYDKTQTTNVLGQAFNLGGKTTGGETFSDIVKRIWNSDFVPAVEVLRGTAQAKGSRLKSIAEYKNTSPLSHSLNYIMWEFKWFPYYETLNGSYTRDLAGQLSYLYDWTFARALWMNESYNGPQQPQANYYLTGFGFGGWGSKDYPLIKNADGTYQADITFKAGTDYQFKIFNDNKEYYTADITDEITGKYITLDEADHDNARINPEEDLDVTVIFSGASFVIRLKEQTTTATEPTTTSSEVTTSSTEPTTSSEVITSSTEPTATTPTETKPTEPVVTEPTVPTLPVVKKTTLTLAKSSASIYVKGTATIKATVKNGSGKTTYKSSNTKVAKVDSKGKVTALKKGIAKITVTNNKVSKTFIVTVKNPKLNKTSVTIAKGRTFTLKITGKVGTAKFTTSNKKIATVNSKGKITVNKKAKKGKTCTITVKTNGITLKCKVKVK